MKKKSIKILRITAKTLLWIIIAILVIIGGSAAYLYFNQEEIKQKVITEFNKSLQTEISVGYIDLSILQNFPYTSVTFKNLKAKSTNHKDNDLLLEAENAAFSLDLFDLFNKNYTIKRIFLNDAKINIKYFADGSNNFEFWKSNPNDTSEINFFLKKVKIKNTILYYEDLPSEQYYTYIINSLTASGDFVGNISEIKGSADIFVQSHKSHKLVILKNKNVKLDARFAVDSKNHVFTLKKGEVKLEDMSFNVAGNIDYTKNSERIYFFITGNKLLLHQFFSVLPEDFQKTTKPYNSKGIIDFKAIVKGSIAGDDIPEIKANFRLNDGELHHEDSKISCKNIRLKGTFSNGNKHLPETYNLNLSDFYIQLHDDTLSGNLKVNNFLDPTVSTNVVATINLENLSKFFAFKNIEELKGKGKVKLSFKHTFIKKENLIAVDFLQDDISGKLSFKNISFKSSKIPYSIKITSIDALLDNTSINAVQFNGNFNNTELSFNGELKNFIPYIFSDNEALAVNGNLNVKDIDLNSFTAKNNSNASEKNTLAIGIPENIKLNVNTKISSIRYEKLTANNITAAINYNAPYITVAGITADIFNGKIAADLNAVMNEKDINLKINFSNENIDFTKFMQDFNNFNQTNFTDKNVKGKLSSTLQIQCIYNIDKGLDKKSLILHSDIKIENGELINASMMQKLSKFIDEESLKNIKFSTLENTIDIKDEVVYIPEMKIALNDMNFAVSGTHNFNNDINYHLNIKLSEILSQRRKARHKDKTNEFGIEEEEDGRVTLFILIYGNVDNPKFKYDKRSATKKFNENMQIEKQSIKSALNKEFEWTKKNEEKVEQERSWKEQEKGKFLINWEEEEQPKTETKTKSEENNKKKEKFRIEFEDE